MAAAQVLVRRGYARATTNHIASKAGVSIGSLYEYFPNKEAIVLALLEAHLVEAQDKLASAALEWLPSAPVAPLVRTIERLVEAMIQLHEADPGLHRVLFEQALSIPAVRRRAEALEEHFVELTTTLLQTHPEARVTDPALSARIVVRTVEHLVHSWVTMPNATPASPQSYRTELVKLVHGYLSVPTLGEAGKRAAKAHRLVGAPLTAASRRFQRELASHGSRAITSTK